MTAAGGTPAQFSLVIRQTDELIGNELDWLETLTDEVGGVLHGPDKRLRGYGHVVGRILEMRRHLLAVGRPIAITLEGELTEQMYAIMEELRTSYADRFEYTEEPSETPGYTRLVMIADGLPEEL